MEFLIRNLEMFLKTSSAGPKGRGGAESASRSFTGVARLGAGLSEAFRNIFKIGIKNAMLSSPLLVFRLSFFPFALDFGSDALLLLFELFHNTS